MHYCNTTYNARMAGRRNMDILDYTRGKHAGTFGTPTNNMFRYRAVCH